MPHLSDDIKSHIINISDNYGLMKTNYGCLSRIMGDIINNLSRKSKPVLWNRKEKFVLFRDHWSYTETGEIIKS